MKSANSQIFRFSGVEVHEGEFCLYKEGEKLAVEPKTFHLLLYFLRHPQKLIPKEELLNAVWGDAAVTENSLAQNIAKLRRQLGDDSRDPRYIETVATVGYRFVCDVEVAEDASGAEEAPSAPIAPRSESKKTGSRKRMWGWALAGGGVLALCVAGAVWYLHRPPPPRVTEYLQITHDGHEKTLAGTDGSRLYFSQMSPISIAQVATTGGEIAQVPVAVRGLRSLWDVSSDGSSFLVASAQEKNNNSEVWSVSILGGQVRPLGEAWSAAFSPDGKSVAYSTREGDIFLVQSDGTGARKLASPGPFPSSLAWSPKGGVIRFFRDEKLWEMLSNGSNLRPVLPGWHTSSGECCGRWNPDGSFFLFISGDPVSGKDVIWALDERRGPLRPPRAEPIQVTTGPILWASPVPSKDGKKIFAEGFTRRGELSRYDSQTKQLQPFLGGISAESVSFSRDGKSVVYVSYPEGILWKANRDGSNPVQLAGKPFHPYNPRWSPDGTQILFGDAYRVRPLAYIVSTEGGSPQPLLSEDKGQQSDPNWSPDGRKVVFGSEVARDPKTLRLCFLDLDNHNVTTVPGSAGMWSPRWSPDGRYIAARTFNQPRLMIYDTQTQQWSQLLRRELSHVSGTTDFPQFSQDSQFIYFLSVTGDRGVFRARVKGGDLERVADLKDWHLTGTWGFWMELDPTDAPLLLRDVGSHDVYALTLDEK